MGLTVTFVITTNNVVVSIVRKWVNPKVRVPVYITSIATIVTVAQLVLQAYFPVLYKAMGIYLALVVVFAIILARSNATTVLPVPARPLMATIFCCSKKPSILHCSSVYLRYTKS